MKINLIVVIRGHDSQITFGLEQPMIVDLIYDAIRNCSIRLGPIIFVSHS